MAKKQKKIKEAIDYKKIELIRKAKVIESRLNSGKLSMKDIKPIDYYIFCMGMKLLESKEFLD